MRRRDFIILPGSLAASLFYLPVAAYAQQPIPVVGFIRTSSAGGSAHLVTAFRQGLNETGYIEGQNVTVEYRWAEGQPDRLPALADDLVKLRVAAIVAGASDASIAAKAATSTIPIVFVTAVDPVAYGLVTSLNRPGGNATGMSYLTSALGAKRLEFLQQVVPAAKSIAVLINPDNPTSEPFIRDIQSGAQVLGLRILIANVTNSDDLASIFAHLAQQVADALIVGPDPFFTSQAAQLAALSARYALPAIYTTREYAEAGALMTWGTSLTDQYRLAGIYAGKILKGAKPAELPVLQPTKYELVINLKTAKALGLTIPDKLLALADEVIE